MPALNSISSVPAKMSSPVPLIAAFAVTVFSTITLRFNVTGELKFNSYSKELKVSELEKMILFVSPFPRYNTPGEEIVNLESMPDGTVKSSAAT